MLFSWTRATHRNASSAFESTSRTAWRRDQLASAAGQFFDRLGPAEPVKALA
jgi:hypothetical protein